ncbi:MAG: molybdopterin-dependent oxidoreductase [Burkholderiaceae bacterium]|nr:molybdopterin-dependent oxidoreductase [Burkholderiaceae bacterium]
MLTRTQIAAPCAAPRREFLKTTGVLASAAGFGLGPMSAAVAQAMDEVEVTTWSSCTVNCGSRCPLKVVSKRGQVIRIEPDDTGTDACDTPQVRACVRGRSMRQRLYSNERLKYPMKRVGPRGEGRFERVSWDEALDTVAAALKRVIAQYGNEAVYYQYASGTYQLVSGRAPNYRLLNMLGGYLNQYGTYSSAQIREGMPYTYGTAGNGSYMPEVANARLYLSFGNSPLTTRQSGGGKGYEFQCAKDAGKVRTILVDPYYTDSMLGKEDQWVAIRPGTDAALCEAIAYVLITENLVDQPFLDQYCVGYDEKTLPASAPKNGDYKSYILGKGADGQAKTPKWAAQITGIPSATIVKLAREIGTTKPLFVSQGYGVQRQANGEQSVRAIAMIPILTGQIGLPGTNTGAREGDVELGAVGMPTGTNPVKANLPFFLWTDAISRGTELTAKKDGIRGVDKLRVPIKFMWNYAGNTLINQHSPAARPDAAGELRLRRRRLCLRLGQLRGHVAAGGQAALRGAVVVRDLPRPGTALRHRREVHRRPHTGTVGRVVLRRDAQEVPGTAGLCDLPEAGPGQALQQGQGAHRPRRLPQGPGQEQAGHAQRQDRDLLRAAGQDRGRMGTARR